MVRPGDEMLDIGCGWGTLALHAAKNYGAKSTGITIAEKQTAFGNARIAKAGLADKARIECLDYRAIPRRQYDRISSLEMVEHVGIKNLPKYFGLVHDLLKDDGLFLLQFAGLRRGGGQGVPPVGHAPGGHDLGPLHEQVHLPRRRRVAPAERHVQGDGEGGLRHPLRREHQHPLLAHHQAVARQLAAQPRRHPRRPTASAGTACGTSSSRGRGASARRATPRASRSSRTRTSTSFDRKIFIGKHSLGQVRPAQERMVAKNGTAHAE